MSSCFHSYFLVSTSLHKLHNSSVKSPPPPLDNGIDKQPEYTLNYLKVTIRIKTTASRPEDDKSSSSESIQAFFSQLAEGINLSRLKSPLCLVFPSATERGM